MNETDRMVGVGNRLIQAIEDQTKVMGRHSKSLTWATYALVLATILLATVTVVMRFYP